MYFFLTLTYLLILYKCLCFYLIPLDLRKFLWTLLLYYKILFLSLTYHSRKKMYILHNSSGHVLVLLLSLIKMPVRVLLCECHVKL